ncbi:MAG: putative lipid II flippase FtsW [Alphaproteobacteria bacterium]|nr:putative lipid II flippase FtsW [Alphaproteobacteria bacterium]
MLSRTDRSLLARWWWTVDHWSVACIAALIAAGLLLALAASPAVAHRIGLEPFYFVYRQLSFVAPSLVLIFAISLLGPRDVRRFALLLFVGSFILLMATLIVGPEIKGATRWLQIGAFSIEPSEFVKPSVVVLIAAVLAERNRNPAFPGTALAVAFYVAVAGVLILQPDFGQTLLLTVVCAALFFLAGLRWYWMAGFGAAAMAGAVGTYLLVPHVASRIDRFINPEHGDTFQVSTALSAFMQGGLTGVGPGEGTVKFVLPDAHTDFIFAVAGEEFGLGACMFLILLFGVIVVRALNRALAERDHFVQLAASGLAVMFGLQAFINIAVNLNLIPAKGMTLPFVSYGGSSMLALALTTGMLLALTRRRPPTAQKR